MALLIIHCSLLIGNMYLLEFEQRHCERALINKYINYNSIT